MQAQPVPQAPGGYAPGRMQGYPQQTAPAPIQQAPAGYPGQQGVPYQQPQMQPPVQGAPNTFASNVAAADSILPPQLFGESQQVA